jgi:transcriptional regulator with PAS, ATPase and Fis domain
VLLKEGKIRSDLFYTLSVQTLNIPPLRERKEDIEDSIKYYIEYYSGMYSKPVSIVKSALEFMMEYSWPGNQRQLDNFCHRIVLLTPRRNIDEAFVRSNLTDMEPLAEEAAAAEPLVYNRDASSVIINALKRNNGSRLETAKELGISTTTLWRKMQKYGITLS